MLNAKADRSLPWRSTRGEPSVRYGLRYEEASIRRELFHSRRTAEPMSERGGAAPPAGGAIGLAPGSHRAPRLMPTAYLPEDSDFFTRGDVELRAFSGSEIREPPLDFGTWVQPGRSRGAWVVGDAHLFTTERHRCIFRHASVLPIPDTLPGFRLSQA
jgi:hypothetical protein